MNRSHLPPTRWFSLSGRELLVLAVGVGIVLSAMVLARASGCIWGHGEVSVSEEADVLLQPARLDINAAEQYELEVLEGIGPKTARAIVQYRNEHGPFASLEELTDVPGIGPKTVERIRPRAMCAPASTPAKRDGD